MSELTVSEVDAAIFKARHRIIAALQVLSETLGDGWSYDLEVDWIDVTTNNSETRESVLGMVRLEAKRVSL